MADIRRDSNIPQSVREWESYYGFSVPAGSFNVVDYGAIPDDGVTDCSPGIQAALDAASQIVSVSGAGRRSGIVVVPPGIYVLRSQIVVPSLVHLVGFGAGISYLWAHSGYFPINTAIVRLGRVSEEGNQSYCTVENLTINCGGGLIAGSIGVQMTQAQESAGVLNSTIALYKDTGIFIDRCANVVLKDLILDDYNQGCNYAINIVSTGGTNILQKATLLGKCANSLLHIGPDCHFDIEGIHTEGDRSGGAALTTAIDIYDSVVMARNISSHTTVVTMIRIHNSGTPLERFIGMSLWGGGCTNVIIDEADTTATLTSAETSGGRVGMYISNSTKILWRGGDFSIASPAGTLTTTGPVIVYNGEVRVNDDLRVVNGQSTTSAAPVGPLRLGAYYLWVDDGGLLRMKSGAPANSTDGTVVGSQA